MEELYVEGVATHGGPESCVGVREGTGEALGWARAGRAIEPRNNRVRGADAVYGSGRQHRQQRYRELLVGPARSENHGMYGTFMRENREVPRLARPGDHRAGRSGNAEAVRLRCTDAGKSDGCVVPAKPSNNAATAAAEVVEGRRPAKGNTDRLKHIPDAGPGACVTWSGPCA